MEKKFLNQEEIELVKQLQNSSQEITNLVGGVEVKLITLQEQKEQLKVELKKLQNQEIEITKMIESKYGKGTILLDTGEFLPNL